LLKWGGLTVAILGILFLYADLHGPRLIIPKTPDIEISEITPAMNFAQVCLRGKATFAKYDEEMRALGITLTNPDNEQVSIFIRAYDAETKRLIEMEKQRLDKGDPQPKFPAVGDNLLVRGNLRIRSGFNMMILQFAEGLRIDRPQAIQITIENLVENKEKWADYQRFEIGWDNSRPAKIIARTDYDWATILTVYELESEAEISLMIPQVLTMFGRTLEAKIGDTIHARGAFSLYHGSPQLWLASWDDLG
jgi:hypothetical protein